MLTDAELQRITQEYHDKLAVQQLEEKKQQELYSTATLTKMGMLAEIIKAANFNIDIKEAHNEQYFIVQTITEKLKISTKYEELESKNIQLQEKIRLLEKEHDGLKFQCIQQNIELTSCQESKRELSGCCEDLLSASNDENQCVV